VPGLNKREAEMKSNKWTNTFIVIAMLSFVIMIFPITMTSIESSLMDAQVDTATGVVDTVNSGTMTLSQPLYDSSVTYVATVTSSSGTDTPVASTYAASTELLTVTGLTWSGTRTLTTTYTYSLTEDYPGLKDVMEVTPLILWVIIIFGTGAAGIFAVRAKLKG